MRFEDLLLAHHSDDVDTFYAWVHDELREGRIHKGIYLRAFEAASGDKEVARRKYIRMRVEQVRRLVAEYSDNSNRIAQLTHEIGSLMPHAEALSAIEHQMAEVEREIEALTQREKELRGKHEDFVRYEEYAPKFVVKSVVAFILIGPALWYVVNRFVGYGGRELKLVIPLLRSTITLPLVNVMILLFCAVAAIILVVLFVLGRRKELRKLGGKRGVNDLRSSEREYETVTQSLASLQKKRQSLEKQRGRIVAVFGLRQLLKRSDVNQLHGEIQSLRRRNEQILEHVVGTR